MRSAVGGRAGGRGKVAATKLHRTVNISVALSRQRGWQGAGSQGSQGHLRGSRRRRRAPPRRPRRGSARRASAAASSAARAPRTAQAPCWHAARRGAVKARPSGRQPPAPARSRSRGGTITFPRRDHYVPEAGPWRDRYTYPSSNPGGGGGGTTTGGRRPGQPPGSHCGASRAGPAPPQRPLVSRCCAPLAEGRSLFCDPLPWEER